jgi:hypothetical protein
MRKTLAVMLLPVLAGAVALEWHGQASAGLTVAYDTSFYGSAAFRYIPSLNLSAGPFDAEAALNVFSSASVRTDDISRYDARIKPYRLSARFSTGRIEARVGLQKISFGSATLLRPLQWFDRVDPRDPLALTDGIYALLGRYYFQNNVNVWAWGLLGNSAPKGWEQFGSEMWSPEFGGRAQLPVPRGEVAATYHHRRFEYVHWVPPDRIETIQVPEDRIGLDGKWDIGVGLEFEATVTHCDSGRLPREWQRMATVGLDYTFGLGGGVGLTVEHMVVDYSDDPFRAGQTAQLTALYAGYPLGLLDNLRLIAYADWTNRNLYSFVGWQRTTDNWVFSLSVFANPERPATAGAVGGAAGKGVRLDVAFNH